MIQRKAFSTLSLLISCICYQEKRHSFDVFLQVCRQSLCVCDLRLCGSNSPWSSPKCFPTGHTQNMPFDYNLQPPSLWLVSVHNAFGFRVNCKFVFKQRVFYLMLHARSVCWLLPFHSHPAMPHCLRLFFSKVLAAFLFL